MSITVEIISVEVRNCTCGVCQHGWRSTKADIPEKCPSCRSRVWNSGRQPRSHIGEIRLPAARKRGRPKTKTITDEWDEFD